MEQLTEIRVRTKIPESEMEQKVGKILAESDYNVRLTGPARVMLPDGKPLLIYLPRYLNGERFEQAYDVLHPIKMSGNRGLASGAPGFTVGGRRRYKQVNSAIIGSVDPLGNTPYCRTTAWTGDHTEEFSSLFPLFMDVDRAFAEYVPERYTAQKQRANATLPEWMVGDTVFTTMTVNNTYPTGVHKDAGDLDEGFSCLTTWRRGNYSGGHLTFPEWRVSVDLQDGDLILMDAHHWHGNTALNLLTADAERISLVLYYRTKVADCASAEEEAHKEVMAKKRSMGETRPTRAVWNGNTTALGKIPSMDVDAMNESVSTSD